MKCRRVQDLISPYLDHRLTGQEMLEIQEHLAACSECAEEFQVIRQIRSVLRSLGTRQPTVSLETRLMTRLSEETDSETNRVFVTVPAISQRSRRATAALALSCLGFFSAAPLFAPPSSEVASTRASVRSLFVSDPYARQAVQTSFQPVGFLPGRVSNFLFGPGLAVTSVGHNRPPRTDRYEQHQMSASIQDLNGPSWDNARLTMGGNTVMAGYMSR